MNILIVEDSATLRHVMCLFIGRAGHTPIIAENGEQAVQIFDSQPVDMVIMDIEMPGLDGYETTRIMRDYLNQEDLWLPIIFVTGKNEEEDLRKGIEVGGDDYLIKPVSETILTAKIRAMERIIDMRNEMQRLNQNLIELSERDGLTHLYNRRTFDDRADKLWKQAARDGSPVAILIMDIDHFKLYNDYYGHVAGDDCIQRVADALLESLQRPGDLLARYGGEEFIVMLTNTDEEGASHVAEKMRLKVKELKIPHKHSLSGDFISMSFGGAVLDNTTDVEIKDLIHAADQALYLSKSNRRDCSTIKRFNPQIHLLVADKNGSLFRSLDGKLIQFITSLQVNTPRELIDQARQNLPDAIVIHDNISEHDVLGIIESIRNGKASSLIPVYVVSNSLDESLEPAYRDLDIEMQIKEAQVKETLIPALNKLLFN